MNYSNLQQPLSLDLLFRGSDREEMKTKTLARAPPLGLPNAHVNRVNRMKEMIGERK